jgi:hypothetical protein
VQSGRESLQQHPKSPDGAAPGTVPVVAGAESATTTQPIAGTSVPPQSVLRVEAVTEGSFVTFDSGRKHLARVVAANVGKVEVRRFDKKSGEWRTKSETRERDTCIPLTTEDAEASFPGCLAAWNGATQSLTDGGEVSRQMSRNSAPQAVTPTASDSVSDFVSVYSDKKKIIDDLTGKFVDTAAEAKQAQDAILPHLADMQSLLSKKGTNHNLVIAARKQGHKIPWWTEYYESYKDKLWESLRTMERRIAAYRKDPTAPVQKPDRDPLPHFNKTERKALVEGNHCAVEIVAALEAGRDAKEEIADFKAVMNAKRLDDILQAHEQEPDYKGILLKVVQTVFDMNASLPAAFVKAVDELTKPCKFKAALPPIPTQWTNGSGTNGAVKKPLQIAPIPQKTPEWMPLEPGKKYTARPHPQGGWGVYEPGSTVCWQRQPSQHEAWEAIEAVNSISVSAPQPSDSLSEVRLG